MRTSSTTRRSSGGRPASFIARFFHGLDVRTALMMGLVITYLWRFQDLAPVLAPLRIPLLLSVAAILVLLFHPNWPVLGRALRRPYVIIYLVWTAWLGIGTFFALNPDAAWTFWSDYHLTNVLMFVFLLSTLGRLSSIRLAVAGHLMGVSIITFYYIRQGFPTDWTPLQGVDRNDLALMFNLAIPLAFFYALTEKERHARWIAWGLVAVVGLSAVLTQSRGGFLTIAVAVAFLAFRVRRVTLQQRFLPLVAFVVGVFFLPQDVKDRLGTILETESDYNRTEESGRVPIWIRGIGYMMDRPVTGVGMENFARAERTLAEEARTQRRWRGHAAHNIFVQAGAEGGVPALLLFVSMLIASVVSLNRTRARLVRRKAPENWILLGDLLTASFIAYCVGGFFLSWPYSPFLLFLMAMTAGYQFCEDHIARLGRPRRPTTRRRVRRRPRPSSTPVLIDTRS